MRLFILIKTKDEFEEKKTHLKEIFLQNKTAWNKKFNLFPLIFLSVIEKNEIEQKKRDDERVSNFRGIDFDDWFEHSRDW